MPASKYASSSFSRLNNSSFKGNGFVSYGTPNKGNGRRDKNFGQSSQARSSFLPDDATSLVEARENSRILEEIDLQMGFGKYEAGPAKVGWLINMHTVSFRLSLSFYN